MNNIDITQAVNILFQAADAATAAGVFKTTRDVALLDQAKGVVGEYFQSQFKEEKEGEEKKK